MTHKLGMEGGGGSLGLTVTIQQTNKHFNLKQVVLTGTQGRTSHVKRDKSLISKVERLIYVELDM